MMRDYELTKANMEDLMKEFANYYLHALDNNRKTGTLNMSKEAKHLAQLKFKVLKSQIQVTMKAIERNLFMDNPMK